MTYSESESGLNFAINSASAFDSTSEFGSESESDFSSVFMNLYWHQLNWLPRLMKFFFIKPNIVKF